MSEVRAWARIDTQALKKNLAQVRTHCPQSQVIPVIKANGYGHGMKQVAQALANTPSRIDGFAVASVDEALELKGLDLDIPILLLPGFLNREELLECFSQDIRPVVHSAYQVAILVEELERDPFVGTRRIWLKHNSGMNRLGFDSDSCVEAFTGLHKYPDVELVLMSHLAWADDPDDPDSATHTQQQLSQFESVRQRLQQTSVGEFDCSMAASAGIINLPQSHYQKVRPGIMLYGGSPLANASGEDLGLAPVMSLYSRLIAINEVKAGESIGYGCTYTCTSDTRVGVVSIGYGDGYPRSAANGTPVVVMTEAGATRTRLIGRVSMDMITIDITGMNLAQVGDEVLLWGAGLSADEVARNADTISYELFCQVTPRVQVDYS